MVEAVLLSLFMVGISSDFPITQPDSLNLSFVGNWPFGFAYSIICDPSRDLVFVGSGGGVYIIDVSDPSHPTKISEGIHTPGKIYRLFYQKPYLYIALGSLGLEIWDVSESSSPWRVGWLNLSGVVEDIVVSGSFVYVVNWDGLCVVDVSIPSHPRKIGFCSTPGWAKGVAVSGKYAYVADDYEGLRIIDASIPSDPKEVSALSTQNYLYQITLKIP